MKKNKTFMNSRIFFILMIALAISSQVFSQADRITVIINGKKAGEKMVAEDPVIVSVNKNRYKKLSGLTVMIRQASVNKIYKRTLQITGANEELLFRVPEQRSKPGSYKINLIKTRTLLLKQDIIKVFLAEDPPNEMMRIPSKRKLLVELHLK